MKLTSNSVDQLINLISAASIVNIDKIVVEADIIRRS